jgi:hypothetical protein
MQRDPLIEFRGFPAKLDLIEPLEIALRSLSE